MKTLVNTVISARQQIARELMENMPDRTLPASEELDKLLEGTVSGELEKGLAERDSWFADSLAFIGWLTKLSNVALEGRNPESGDFEFGPNPDFWRERQELSDLLTSALTAYGPANCECSAYFTDWLSLRLPSTLQFLKCYRLYEKRVHSFVQEVWPDMNLEPLELA